MSCGTERDEKQQMNDMTLDILGTQYQVLIKKYDEDPEFKKMSVSGYHNGYTKRIVICDMSTYEGMEDEKPESIACIMRETLRHEIVHAFFNESGLAESSNIPDCPWAKNEEMIDWFAKQGPKIYETWKKAGALDERSETTM